MKTASFKIRTTEIPHYLKAANLLHLELDFSPNESDCDKVVCAVLFTIDDEIASLCFMAGVYCGLYDVQEAIK